MSKSDFDFRQFENYVKKFEKMTTEFDEFLRTFLLQQAQRVVSNAKRRTPVDTGAMRASWGIGSQKITLTKVSKGKSVKIDPENSTIADISVVGNNFEVEIWNSVEGDISDSPEDEEADYDYYTDETKKLLED